VTAKNDPRKLSPRFGLFCGSPVSRLVLLQQVRSRPSHPHSVRRQRLLIIDQPPCFLIAMPDSSVVAPRRQALLCRRGAMLARRSGHSWARLCLCTGGGHLRPLPAATQKATHLAGKRSFPVQKPDFHDIFGCCAKRSEMSSPAFLVLSKRARVANLIHS
jgi:hypothetical protein